MCAEHPLGKWKRTRTRRGPDAERTMAFEETDAGRTRTGRGRGRFSLRAVEPPTPPPPRRGTPLSLRTVK
eukprot:gene15885-biopygen20222